MGHEVDQCYFMMGEMDKSSVFSTPPTSASSSFSSNVALSPTTVCLHDESCRNSSGRVIVKVINSQEDTPSDKCKSPIGVCRPYSNGVVTVWKIFALYFVIILMFGFVYIYTAPTGIKEEFNVTLVEENMDKGLLAISYQQSEQIMRVSCLPEDNTETMFDLDQNLVAHKDVKIEKCFVRSALSVQFINEYEQVKDIIKTHSLVWKRPDEIIPMIVLQRRVNTEVLQNVAGKNIAEFCGDFKTHWLVTSMPKNYDNTLFEKSTLASKGSSKLVSSMFVCSFYRIALHYKS